MARSDEFDRKLGVFERDNVITKAQAIKAFGLVVALLMAWMFFLARIAGETNDAVENEVVPTLQDKVADLEDENAQLEDISRQQTDAILLLIQTLQDNGVEPPQIVIRPTTTTEEQS